MLFLINFFLATATEPSKVNEPNKERDITTQEFVVYFDCGPRSRECESKK